jgi:uncharacterized Zn-binding protein involved in type VI secretion
MLKYLFLPMLLLTLGFSSASAAADDPTGKVTAVEGNQVTLEVSGDMPTWARKGAYVKATSSEGKVVLRGAKIVKVEGKAITVTSVQAKDVQSGKVYKLAKTRVNEGC